MNKSKKNSLLSPSYFGDKIIKSINSEARNFHSKKPQKIKDHSNQHKLHDHKMVLTYILLKILNGDWKVNQNLMSESYLSQKFSCPKSKIHNIMLALQSAQIIHSIPCKSWVVGDFIKNNSILNLDYFDLPFDFRISISQTWSHDCNEVMADYKIFQEILEPNSNFDIEKLFYCKKVFYHEGCSELISVLKYGFVDQLFYDLNTKLIKNNILKLLAINGHVIFRKNRKFVFCHDTKIQNKHSFVLMIYEIIYNQNDEIVLIIKQSHTSKSKLDHLDYSYKVH